MGMVILVLGTLSVILMEVTVLASATLVGTGKIGWQFGLSLIRSIPGGHQVMVRTCPDRRFPASSPIRVEPGDFLTIYS
jgi:hypothetical protein